jgi:hypothetical protein
MASALAHATLAEAKEFLGLTTQDYDTILDACLDRASAWVDRYCGRVFVSQRHYEVKEGGGERLVLRHQPVSAVNFVGTSTDVFLTVTSTTASDIAATVSAFDGKLALRRMDSVGTATATDLALDTYPTTAALAAQVSLTAGFAATVGVSAPSRYLARAAGRDCKGGGAVMLGYSAVSEWQLDEERGIVYGKSLDRWQSVMVDYQGGYTTLPPDVVHATLSMCGNFFRDRTRDSAVASESLGGYSYSIKSGEDMSREIDGLLGPYRRIR